MKFKSSLEALILGCLTEGAMHGYAIARAIEKKSVGALKAGENQLYPALHRLEEEGFVVAEWQEQENKPPRKVYMLTEGGAMELERYRKSWEEFALGVGAILSAPKRITGEGHAN